MAGPFGIFQLPTDERVRYLAPDESFSAELLDEGTAYLRYRFVESPTLSEVSGWIEAGAVQRLILDLRQNPGGDNTTYGSLHQLVADFADANPGAVTVITDRVTFSAASNLATEIEQRTDARFVGEPMGGGVNFWDDVTWVELPSLPIPMRVAVSTTYWQFAPVDDPRLTIEPDVPVPVTAADHFAGHDPALEAALSGD
jgi:C-terminal processing protease CtpA/Prc